MPQVRVFVLHPSFERCQEIIEAFQQWEELELLPLANLRRAPERIEQEEPDLIVAAVDSTSDRSLKTIEMIRKKGDRPAIMVVSRQPSQDLLLQCMRAGTDEFVEFPPQPEELSKALDRLKRKIGLIKEQRGKVIGVYSSTGGCGTTTLACNLGANIARELGGPNSSCLIDLDLRYGSVALCMDVRQFSHNLVDAARDVERLDAPLLENYMSAHASGAAVLPAPLGLEEAEGLEPESVGGVIELCKRNYRISVLDLPHTMDDYVVVGLDSSDEIFLVCDMMLPAIRNTIRARELFEKLDYKKDKIKLVINRYYNSEHVSVREMSEHIGVPIYWLVPYDSKVAIKAINSGKTFAEIDPDSDIAQCLLAMAQVTAGVKVEEREKKKVSLFSWRR